MISQTIHNKTIYITRDTPLIGIGRFADIRRLVRWYRPIVLYTVGK